MISVSEAARATLPIAKVLMFCLLPEPMDDARRRALHQSRCQNRASTEPRSATEAALESDAAVVVGKFSVPFEGSIGRDFSASNDSFEQNYPARAAALGNDRVSSSAALRVAVNVELRGEPCSHRRCFVRVLRSESHIVS